MKVLGLLCMIAGLAIGVLAAYVWWPERTEEWPGLWPGVTALGAGGLWFLGYRLWGGNTDEDGY